jgi:predicted signal transduction protein with EAL and GGDEF domain
VFAKITPVKRRNTGRKHIPIYVMKTAIVLEEFVLLRLYVSRSNPVFQNIMENMLSKKIICICFLLLTLTKYKAMNNTNKVEINK